MDTLLSVSHVSYSYHTLSGETPALSDITFSVKEGEFLSIVGPSGCGKSTLLSLLASLMEPESGTIILRGKPLAPHTANIGYMLQKDHLFEWRTVYRNIVLGLEIQKKMTPAYLHHVDQLMEAYGLWAFRNSRPSELSGGMRQRAALIRTLALDPELLLLDEPFSVRQIIRQEKKTAILVTHDLSEAISMADRVLVLSKRPATIHLDLPTIFEDQTLSPMNRRQAPEFQGYFNQIWKELNHHG